MYRRKYKKIHNFFSTDRKCINTRDKEIEEVISIKTVYKTKVIDSESLCQTLYQILFIILLRYLIKLNAWGLPTTVKNVKELIKKNVRKNIAKNVKGKNR